MRQTNIEIDETKLEKVKALTGATTIKEAVDRAFQELIRIDRQKKYCPIGVWVAGKVTLIRCGDVNGSC